MGFNGELYELDLKYFLNNLEKFKNENELGRTIPYNVIGNFNSSNQSSTWIFFGNVLEKHYPHIYKQYHNLTYRLNDSDSIEGYLLPDEVKELLNDMEKINYDDFLIKFKNELKKDNFELVTFEYDFFQECINLKTKPNNSIELLKEVLRYVLNNNTVLCLSLTW